MIIIGVVLVLAILVLGGRGKETPEQLAQPVNQNDVSDEVVNPEHNNDVIPQVVDTGELQIIDLKEGVGEAVTLGTSVSVHYTGTLIDGTPFDSSYDRGVPFQVTVGSGQVIKGWEQGLLGMKVGGQRQLVIPAALAYGDRSPSPTIPANATLVFVLELLEIN